jgi:hypothetical protein
MLAMFEPDGNPPIAIAIFPANLIKDQPESRQSNTV